jgi:Ca2+-binding RTX toxin-like protein
MAFITDPSTGTDTVTGTDTADTFIWRGGDDTYEGGGGGDTLVLEDPLALFWRLGGPELTGRLASGVTPNISTTSVETFEFIAAPFPDRFQLLVQGSEAADRIAVRTDTDVPYAVYGNGGDDTLITRGDGSIFFLVDGAVARATTASKSGQTVALSGSTEKAALTVWWWMPRVRMYSCASRTRQERRQKPLQSCLGIPAT